MPSMNQALLIILSISVLGPIIGSLIGVIKEPSKKFMFNMLSFAGGVMLAISFLELIPESIELSSAFISTVGIIFGAFLMYSLDKLIPHIHPELCEQEQGCKLKKTATYLIFGIFLHNLPEGMAIALGSVSGMKVGLVIALAIAIHNIPEGICTSAPYYHCTGKRLKSFLISSSTLAATSLLPEAWQADPEQSVIQGLFGSLFDRIPFLSSSNSAGEFIVGILFP